MPFYIRFLKQPQVLKQNGNSSLITTLITITTDLGDSFLADDVEVTATVHFSRPISPLRQIINWTAGNREQKVTFGPIRGDLSSCSVQLSVCPTPLVDADSLEGRKLTWIISAWSPWFDGSHGKPAEKLVLRRFKTKIGAELKIWEETGNSIARHIWDAALAAIVEFQTELASGRGQPFGKTHKPNFNVLELGSGCGIVGIALAQMLPNCSVMLTDLEEVRDIIQRNISTAQPAQNSQIEFQTLDWDEELPQEVSSRRHDLIFLSDCTYNSDTLPALTATIKSLLDLSPDALVLVAWKKRCQSELVFFDLMRDAGLAVLGPPSCPLLRDCEPGSGYDEVRDIKIYRFQRASA